MKKASRGDFYVLSGAVDETRTRGMLEPQSSVLTNFTIAAILLMYITINKK